MYRLLASNFRKLGILAIAIVVVFGLAASSVHAQESSTLFSDLSFTKGSTLINQGSMIDECISGFDNTYCWVPQVWSIMRGLSNIMVLLFLFIAAAATTLNLQVGTYGIKRMLPSVITGTMFANFSREIASILMSVESAVRNGLLSFISNGTSSGGDLAWGTLASPVNFAIESIKPQPTVPSIIGGIIYLVLGAAGILALLLLILMFWIRKLFLGFLIVLAPLAFLAMAAPFSQGLFRKWWGEFAKWMFQPTISVFFIVVGGMITAAAAAGGFGLIAFIASLGSIFLAIKTPLAMGGLVGAAAGFVAGNTWGRAKGAIGQNAEILAHRIPGVGNALRVLQKGPAQRQKVLEGMRKRPVAKSTKRRDQLLQEYGSPAEQRRATLRLANPLRNFRNFLAEGYENSTLAAERVGKNAEINAKWTRAGALNRRQSLGLRGSSADDMARDKFEDELATKDAEHIQVKAEDEYRQGNPGLNTALAATEEQITGFKDKLEGLANTFKAVALKSDESVRALRRQGTIMKELGTLGYNEQLAAVKKEIRETRDEKSYKGSITEELEQDTQLRAQLEQLMGEDIGEKGSIMKTALVRLGGSKKNLENTIEAIEKAEHVLYNDDMVSAISTAYQTLGDLDKLPEDNSEVRAFKAAHNGMAFSGLINHSFENTEEGRQAFNAAMSDAFKYMGTRGGDMLTQLGIDKLSKEDQMKYLFNFLSSGNDEMRSVSMINGAKSRSETVSGQRSFISKDATLDTIASTLQADLDSGKLGNALKLADEGGLYSEPGNSFYRSLGTTHQERRKALGASDKAMSRVHAAVGDKLMSLRDISDLNAVFAEDGTLGKLGTVLNKIGTARGAASLTESGTTLQIGRDKVTLANAMKALNGEGTVMGIDGSPMKEVQLRAAITSAVKEHLSGAIHLPDSPVDNAWLAAAA